MARKFKDKEWIEFDSRRMKLDDSKVSESPASWVSFEAFLEGYAVEFEANSDIAVSSSSAFLPVSKAFLMTFALVGRFSDEPDRRRKIKGDGARTWDRRNARKYPQYDFEVGVRHGHRLFTEIHGLTGTLSFKMPDEDSHEPVAGDIVKSSWSVVFDGESILEPLQIPSNPINLQHERVEVQQMVGILMLTNEEFADLVYQSARHMTVSSKVPIEFDFRAGTLTIPSTFGTVQTFELDVENLQRQQQLQLGAQGKISVEHSDILKAALRAYLRSLMLASCYDAEPLTDCFDSITGDILYMA
ncbi:unnamed protein product [Alternaria alternata]